MRFVIPTIYTAVDQMSRPIYAIGAAMDQMNGKSRQLNSGIQNLIPSLGSLATGIAGAFSAKSIMDYETAVASFRTIVSDLSDAQFTKFTDEIKTVAEVTRKSSVDVASSFETIAGLNAEFAKTAEGLGAVSTASITLAKASRMDLQPAAENLVGIMNQFDFAANQADRAINVLAAGQAVGAASISQTSEALRVFGAVAQSSNTSIEQSVALIETLAAKSIKGSDAGTALRGSFVRLQKAGLGFKSGQFQINDALEDASARVNALGSEQLKTAYVTELFGVENLTAGKILMSSIDTIKGFTASVTGTTEASRAAAINSQTLANRIDELKNKFITLVTTSDSASIGLNMVKGVVATITDNMGLLLSVAIPVIAAFVTWKGVLYATQAYVWLANAATVAYEFTIGVLTGALNGSVIALGLSNIALKGYTIGTWLATAATAAFNVAMAIGIGKLLLIGTAIIAGIALIYEFVTSIKGWGDMFTATMTLSHDMFNAYVLYPIKLGLQVLNFAFWALANSVVFAWNWAMNKIGLLSDKRFAEQNKQMSDMQAARMQNIQTTKGAIENSSVKISADMENIKNNSLKWKTDEDFAKERSSTEAIANTSTMNSYSEHKNTVEVMVKAAPGSEAQVSSNPNNIPVTTSSRTY